MKHELIQQLFNTSEYTLTKLNKGYTNQNFLLEVNKESYVLRIPYDDHKDLFQHKYEESVLELVRDLDVPIVYYDQLSGIKITKYIAGIQEYSECEDADKIERSALLLKQLHNKPCIDHDFNPLDTILNYKSKVKHPLYDLKPFEHIIHSIETLNNDFVLCHNDVVSGNLLFGRDKDYLIDYEYASNNDPLFDVMSFISENKIDDIKLRERFYNVYFDEINDQIRHDLKLWEAFHNLLWCYWAMMLLESRNEEMYRNIAKDKYEAILRMKLV